MDRKTALQIKISNKNPENSGHCNKGRKKGNMQGIDVVFENLLYLDECHGRR